MSLKAEYYLFVMQPKQKYLKCLVDEVVTYCKSEMIKGSELPYVVELKAGSVTSVHDLTPLLKDIGIECTAYFETRSTIKVTVNKFI